MLRIQIPEVEYYDYSEERFITLGGTFVDLEHSLYTISLWESHFKVPFISNNDKTNEQVWFYIKCMSYKYDLDMDLIKNLPTECIKEIKAYIEDKMTATWFSKTDNRTGGSSQAITSEIIYYSMVSYNIPFECEHWHLNRLLTLIRVCNEKNQKPKKMSKSSVLNRNAALNAARRKSMGTNG